MDWLTTHYAVIDCRKKHVHFSSPNANSFEFQGIPRGRSIPAISALQAKKLIASGCKWYLANIIDSTKERETVPSDVPVVQEYLTVFKERPPRVSPRQRSRVPYRTNSRDYTNIANPVLISSCRAKGIRSPTGRIIGERPHSTQSLPVGSTSPLCEKERQLTETVHRLPGIE